MPKKLLPNASSASAATSSNISPDSFPLDAISTATISDKALTVVCKKTSSSLLATGGAVGGNLVGGPIVGSASGVMLPLVATDYVADVVKVAAKQVYKIATEKE